MEIDKILRKEAFGKLVLLKEPELELWYNALCDTLPRFDISTKDRIAAFIAQTSHESGGYTKLTENLNYSMTGLRKTWPSRFKSDEEALKYARNPRLIASKVYANRMGNGDEMSGDGWKYRGRGLIQLTGKDNYTRCSKSLFRSDILIDNPNLLLEPYYAILSACWFWNENNLNSFADRGDILGLTKRINGGTIGLADRIKKITLAKSYMS